MKKKSQFETVMEQCKTCDICGGPCHPMYGGGWDNDRICCANLYCQAESTFPTSTAYPGQEADEEKRREENQCQE